MLNIATVIVQGQLLSSGVCHDDGTHPTNRLRDGIRKILEAHATPCRANLT